MLNNQTRISGWTRANGTTSQKITINNRNMGERGALSGGFGSASASSREKLQLRHMMAKANNSLYTANPIEKRRLEQKIAVKTGQLYGIDPKKLMPKMTGSMQQSNGNIRANATDNYGLREKMKAAKLPV